jgi:sugar fermentation stimulation protein A
MMAFVLATPETGASIGKFRYVGTHDLRKKCCMIQYNPIKSLSPLRRNPKMNQTKATMNFTSPLLPGTLLQRYQRFLADIRLSSGELITAHCPNTGRMLTCSAPGSRVMLSRAANPKRKYPLTLEMVEAGSGWVGVNTARTNGLVREAIENGQIAEFREVVRIIPEVSPTPGTRLDLQLCQVTGSTFLEIKHCSLAEDGCAMFPDAVTVRGTKHLRTLASLVAAGHPAAVFFLVERMDADRFAPASHIDPEYSKALSRAVADGVQVLVYQAQVTPAGIDIVKPLPLVLHL